MADEQILHLAAAVDENRVGIFLQQRVSLLRFEVFHRQLSLISKSCVIAAVFASMMDAEQYFSADK